MSVDDDDLARLLNREAERDAILADARDVADGFALVIRTVRDEAGIEDAEELCALAHHWLDKVRPDAARSDDAGAGRGWSTARSDDADEAV